MKPLYVRADREQYADTKAAKSSPLVSQQSLISLRPLILAAKLERNGFYRMAGEVLISNGYITKAKKLARGLHGKRPIDACFTRAMIQKANGNMQAIEEFMQSFCQGNLSRNYYYGAMLVLDHDEQRALSLADRLRDCGNGQLVYDAMRVYFNAGRTEDVETCLDILRKESPRYYAYALCFLGMPGNNRSRFPEELVLHFFEADMQGLEKHISLHEGNQDKLIRYIAAASSLDSDFYEMVSPETVEFLLDQASEIISQMLDEKLFGFEEVKKDIESGNIVRARRSYQFLFRSPSEYFEPKRAQYLMELGDTASKVGTLEAKIFAFDLYWDLFDVLENKPDEALIFDKLISCAKEIYLLGDVRNSWKFFSRIANYLVNTVRTPRLTNKFAKESMNDVPLLSFILYVKSSKYDATCIAAHAALQNNDQQTAKIIAEIVADLFGNHWITRYAIHKLGSHPGTEGLVSTIHGRFGIWHIVNTA